MQYSHQLLEFCCYVQLYCTPNSNVCTGPQLTNCIGSATFDAKYPSWVYPAYSSGVNQSVVGLEMPLFFFLYASSTHMIYVVLKNDYDACLGLQLSSSISHVTLNYKRNVSNSRAGVRYLERSYIRPYPPPSTSSSSTGLLLPCGGGMPAFGCITS